jgi:hypothetical protein
MISVTLNSAKLDFALERLAQAARVDLGKVIKQEGGNVARSIMMIIPPTTANAGTTAKPKSSGLAKAAQQQGENAIKSDLFGGRRKSGARYASIGLFQRIGSSTLQPPKRARTQTAAVRLGWERSKTIRIYFKFWKQNASTEEMKNFHLRYRNKYGRIPFVSQSTIGRWKVQDQMWISDSAADQYLRQVQSNVGWSKAGFAQAALACGQRLPAWVRRHAQKAGTQSHNFTGSNPFVTGTATNIKIPNAERFVQAGLDFRAKITLKKVDAILANRAVNLGFARVDGAGRVQENMPR